MIKNNMSKLAPWKSLFKGGTFKENTGKSIKEDAVIDAVKGSTADKEPPKGHGTHEIKNTKVSGVKGPSNVQPPKGHGDEPSVKSPSNTAVIKAVKSQTADKEPPKGAVKNPVTGENPKTGYQKAVSPMDPGGRKVNDLQYFDYAGRPGQKSESVLQPYKSLKEDEMDMMNQDEDQEREDLINFEPGDMGVGVEETPEEDMTSEEGEEFGISGEEEQKILDIIDDEDMSASEKLDAIKDCLKKEYSDSEEKSDEGESEESESDEESEESDEDMEESVEDMETEEEAY